MIDKLKSIHQTRSYDPLKLSEFTDAFIVTPLSGGLDYLGGALVFWAENVSVESIPVLEFQKISDAELSEETGGDEIFIDEETLRTDLVLKILDDVGSRLVALTPRPSVSYHTATHEELKQSHIQLADYALSLPYPSAYQFWVDLLIQWIESIPASLVTYPETRLSRWIDHMIARFLENKNRPDPHQHIYGWLCLTVEQLINPSTTEDDAENTSAD